jgi:hypothetical protein
MHRLTHTSWCACVCAPLCVCVCVCLHIHGYSFIVLLTVVYPLGVAAGRYEVLPSNMFAVSPNAFEVLNQDLLQIGLQNSSSTWTIGQQVRPRHAPHSLTQTSIQTCTQTCVCACMRVCVCVCVHVSSVSHSLSVGCAVGVLMQEWVVGLQLYGPAGVRGLITGDYYQTALGLTSLTETFIVQLREATQQGTLTRRIPVTPVALLRATYVAPTHPRHRPPDSPPHAAVCVSTCMYVCMCICVLDCTSLWVGAG